MTGAADSAGSWRLAATLARRELRGGLKGFRIFLACLLLGVAVIAAVGSTGAAVRNSILADAQKILGGDVELRVLYKPLTEEQLAFIGESATASHTREMRAMATPVGKDDRALVEMKAVDGIYPLYGAVELDPSMSLAAATELRDGRWGAAADENLIARLDLKIGDELKIGDAIYELRAAITREPDRGSGIFILGPRLMVADGSLDSTGLVQPGSLIYYLYRMKLPPEVARRRLAESAEGKISRWRLAHQGIGGCRRRHAQLHRPHRTLSHPGRARCAIGGRRGRRQCGAQLSAGQDGDAGDAQMPGRPVAPVVPRLSAADHDPGRWRASPPG